ncbi:MAG: hypothetical protein K5650_02390 [Bacteroidales bacterium]|nr:hypothetical protein [Bacteroidales bacterium]
MKRFVFPLAIVAVLVFSSCATSKFYSQDASSVRPLALVQPCSYLTDAVGDFSTVYFESVSKVNNAILMETIPSLGLPIDKVVPFEFNCADKSDATVRWMRHLADVGQTGAQNMTVPADILNAVRGSGCRYGMVLSDIGYVKDARQYNLEKTIETGVKIADALVNNHIDLSNDTEAYLNGMFSVIFDAETGKVVWFGASPRSYKFNPMDYRDMKKQLTKLYKVFL